MKEQLGRLPLQERRNQNSSTASKFIANNLIQEGETKYAGIPDAWLSFHQHLRDAVVFGVALGYAPKDHGELLAGIKTFQNSVNKAKKPEPKPVFPFFIPPTINEEQPQEVVNAGPNPDSAAEVRYSLALARRLDSITEETSLAEARRQTAILAAQAQLTSYGLTHEETVHGVTRDDRLRIVKYFTGLLADANLEWHMPVDPPVKKFTPDRSNQLLDDIDSLLEENPTS